MLWSLQASTADGLLPQSIHCRHSTSPVVSSSCSLHVVLLSLSPCLGLGDVWLLHSKSVSVGLFYPCNKRHLERQESLDRAESSLLCDAQQKLWIQAKHPKLPTGRELLLLRVLRALLVQACPRSAAAGGQPGGQRSRRVGWGGLLLGLGSHGAPALQSRQPAWARMPVRWRVLKHRARQSPRWGFPDAVYWHYLPPWLPQLSPGRLCWQTCLRLGARWAVRGRILVCRGWCSLIMFS